MKPSSVPPSVEDSDLTSKEIVAALSEYNYWLAGPSNEDESSLVASAAAEIERQQQEIARYENSRVVLTQLVERLQLELEQVRANYAQPRFEILDDDLVTDHETGLTWLRYFVPGGKRSHQASMDAANNFTLNGLKFRAATIRERLSINDYERCNPAIDTSVFTSAKEGWEWTSTLDAESPADFAWYVFPYGGSSLRSFRSYYGWVRAVRVGQLVRERR